MSASLAEFIPGVVHDIRIGNGSEARFVAGVDYSIAQRILSSRSADGRGFDLVDNGAIANLQEVEYFDLLGGQAKLTSRSIDRESRCFKHAAVAVSNPDEWVWSKVNLAGGELDGYACLAINHEAREAIVVSLETMVATP